jgi:hypothetical protein
LQTGSERRRHPRRKTNLKTTVTQKGITLSCRLVNLSSAGALIAASFHPSLGSRVDIDLPGLGAAGASVVRVTSAYIALSFDETVDIETVDGHDEPLAQPALAQAAAG